MQGKVNLDLRFVNSEESFSLDELVMKISDAFEKKAMVEILRLILGMIQEILLNRIFQGTTTCPYCSTGKLVHNGGRKRHIRTSIGELPLQLTRVKCKECGRTHIPLLKLLKIRDYQTKTNELEKLVIESVCETSYRRGVENLARAGKIAIPYRTANGWLLRTDCDEIKLSDKIIGSYPLEVMADGTKFKGEGKDGKARQGDLKAVIGITRQGNVFPMGTWTGKSWEYINQEWKKNSVHLPDGSILVCDGELGLADSFADYVDEQQRCQWHIKRDLYHAMHADGAPLKEIKPLQDALSVAMAIELPQTDFQQVLEADKDSIEQRMEDTVKVIDKFVVFLYNKGYHAAASYIDNAKHFMFGYIRRWLKWGLVSHKASSMIERVMRELARRLKKISYGWSDKGAKKVASVILKRFTDIDEWEKEWKEKMNITNKIFVFVGNYQCSSPNFAH